MKSKIVLPTAQEGERYDTVEVRFSPEEEAKKTFHYDIKDVEMGSLAYLLR